MIVAQHASIPSPRFAFMMPPATVSAVAYAPHSRAGDEEGPDVFGRRRPQIQVRIRRVAASGVLEPVGDGRGGARPGYVRSAGPVFVAQPRAGARAPPAPPHS